MSEQPIQKTPEDWEAFCTRCPVHSHVLAKFKTAYAAVRHSLRTGQTYDFRNLFGAASASSGRVPEQNQMMYEDLCAAKKWSDANPLTEWVTDIVDNTGLFGNGKVDLDACLKKARVPYPSTRYRLEIDLSRPGVWVDPIPRLFVVFADPDRPVPYTLNPNEPR